MNRKLKLLLADGLILFVMSSVIAIGVQQSIKALKKDKGASDDPIVTAMLQDNLDEVTKLVAKGPEMTNPKDDLGRSALLRTAYVNLSRPSPPSAATVFINRVFSAMGVGPVISEEAGIDPHIHADERRLKFATLLLDHGAKVDSVDNDGWTALMWAAWSGLSNVANLLVERGCPLNAADRQGNTALIIAAQRGNHEIVEILVTKHADLSLRNRAGLTALEAAERGLRAHPAKSYEELQEGFKKTISLLRSPD